MASLEEVAENLEQQADDFEKAAKKSREYGGDSHDAWMDKSFVYRTAAKIISADVIIKC